MINKKHNTSSQGSGFRIAMVAVLALILLGGVITGGVIGYTKLQTIWQEQFHIDDPDLNVVITTGKMVHPDVITLHFGLTNGANLATIPFTSLRKHLLESVPNIRDIHIERRLPNRVTVDVTEREPIVRLAPSQGKPSSGCVADVNGVVFRFFNDVEMLPIIREATPNTTLPGKKLTGSAAAALQLVEAASASEFSELRIQEINTSKKDYLLATLGDYSNARIAWDHMGETTQLARTSLKRQLTRLSKAIASRISPRTTLWIATDYGTPGRVYANDPSRSGR